LAHVCFYQSELAPQTSSSSRARIGHLIDSRYPNLSSLQQESADSSSARFDMNYGNRTITPLTVFPFVNPPCLYQAGPEPGISSTVNSQIYPRKEPKGQEGSAESLPADLDMNCGKAPVPVCLSIHHVCIIRGPCLVSPRHQMPPTSLRAARVYRFIDCRS
jgi:hypothetical protein